MAAPITGQQAAGASATQITAQGGLTTFVIKAPISNLAAVFVGPAGVSASTGWQLDPGDVFEYQGESKNGEHFFSSTLSDFWVVGTSPDKVAWIAAL